MEKGYYIGIDSGTHTGLAIWDGARRMFTCIETVPMHRALFRVRDLAKMAEDQGRSLTVVFEDARARKWFPKEMSNSEYRGKLMGAGSVKRDSKIWEEFLKDYHIKFENVPPRKGLTKLDPDYFARLTGFTGRTSEHSRDAAMLVFQR